MLDNNKHEDSSDEDDDIVNTGEKMPIDDMIKLCDQLIGGMEQHTFINVQEIMAVYSIKEKLLRQKPLLMKQMTQEEVHKRAVSRSAAEFENPVPYPKMMVTITTKTTLICHVP